MLIEKEMLMAEVVYHDHNLIPIIGRFGIRMGYDDESIEELCNKHRVNIDFFLTILNVFHDSEYFPQKQMQMFPVGMLVSYLKKAHKDYLEDEIPEIKNLIGSMISECHIDKSTYLLFLNFFDEYKLELENHIYREETKVYPYVVALEKALQTGKADEATMQQMNTYPIAEYEREHENVEEKLNDLKNLMIKYLPTVDDDRLCFRILRELFALEKELNEHARIEDLILVPKVMAMEIAIKNREK